MTHVKTSSLYIGKVSWKPLETYSWISPLATSNWVECIGKGANNNRITAIVYETSNWPQTTSSRSNMLHTSCLYQSQVTEFLLRQQQPPPLIDSLKSNIEFIQTGMRKKLSPDCWPNLLTILIFHLINAKLMSSRLIRGIRTCYRLDRVVIARKVVRSISSAERILTSHPSFACWTFNEGKPIELWINSFFLLRSPRSERLHKRCL